MKFKSIITSVLALSLSVLAFGQKSQYYCNPLPMPVGDGGNASGDVSVMEHNGKYYMYCSGGGAWVSSDLVNWEFHKVDGVMVAPDICEYNGKFYLSGNSDHLFEATDPLGPFVDLGPFTNTGAKADGWLSGFDTKFFVDDDNQPYLFWSGHGISGIYGVKLDPKNLTKFMDKPTHLFGFNPLHSWECYGEANEYETVAWIEGPWIFKHNGVYYIEYSASGTQWQTYACGYYTATSPLGPYSYAPNNPVLKRLDGIVTGTAHGSVVKGPDGNWWQFYTIVFPAPVAGRRIGMDKVVFDEDGLMHVNITDTPQPGPLAKVVDNGHAIKPVSIHKMNASESKSKSSPSQVNSYPSYALDNYAGTAWYPAENEAQPFLTIDLGPATANDKVQYFTVDSFRLLFTSARRARGAAAVLPVYKYKVEVSKDGENFTTVLDKSANTTSKDTIFETFNPVNCRFVKFTFLDWPKSSPLGIIDVTVFGYPDGFDKERSAIPTYFKLPAENR